MPGLNRWGTFPKIRHRCSGLRHRRCRWSGLIEKVIKCAVWIGYEIAESCLIGKPSTILGRANQRLHCFPLSLLATLAS